MQDILSYMWYHINGTQFLFSPKEFTGGLQASSKRVKRKCSKVKKMEQYNYQLIERQVRDIIFNKQLDEFCGYSNSFPDYLNVIKNNKDLFEETLKTFCHQAIEKRLEINKNTVGYDFLKDNFYHLSSQNQNQKQKQKVIKEVEIDDEINFYDCAETKTIKHLKPGRPKGAKNKEKFDELPKYEVTKDNLTNALKDLIWYKPGLKAIELIEYLSFDESLKNYVYRHLHQYSALHWIKTTKQIKNINVERYMPIGNRNGYYYNGKIVSLSELAKLTGKSKQILSYRIKKGMNHFQAINEEINEKMARKNPGE